MASHSLAELARSGIYEIVNTVNGKRYIGSAKCFRIRWGQHRTRLNNGRHHSCHLQAAWKKYGADAFLFKIIELCEPAILLLREQAAIDLLAPAYNVCRNAGNTLGRVHGDETRKKIRAKAIGRKCPPRSEAHRAALSAVQKGRPKAAEHAAAFQAGRLARVYTEEIRKTIGAGLKRAYATGLRPREKTESHKDAMSKAFAKLSEEQVREIRRRRAAGETCKALAIAFRTTGSTVCQIGTGERYRWVSD